MSDNTAQVVRPSRDFEGRAPILSLTGIKKAYGAVTVLRGVDLQIRPGEVVALVGDNGAGKSTLIKTVAGIVRPDEGEYIFDGKQVDIRTPNDATSLGIQTVYQDLALCDNLDAVQNLFLGRELAGAPIFGRRVKRAESQKRAKEVLRQLRLDSISLTRPVGAMSGGQRQNIAIARSILWKPKLVLFDEPTAALSHSAAAQVGELIKGLAADGLGVLVVSHDIHQFVIDVTDTTYVLRLGRVAARFNSKEVSGETIVNSMVGGNEGVNSAG